LLVVSFGNILLGWPQNMWYFGSCFGCLRLGYFARNHVDGIWDSYVNTTLVAAGENDD
jgi:hypothetical protein